VRRLDLTREQLIALGAVLCLMMGCVLLVGYSLTRQAGAAEELAERRAVLTRLVRASASGGGSGSAKAVEAPAAAFIDAPTQGQAGAQLQSHFARLAREQNATVASSGVEAPTQEAPDAIRVQATLEISLNALQKLLYEIETGTPYLTVDSLAIQPSSVSVGQESPQASLRVTLTLRGLWRRGAT